ncbi:MAG: hypothetical protein P1U41_03880 [Vicingaceae bacterium]|nr:hypothetical protein [Vicingaceae bacterium]
MLNNDHIIKSVPFDYGTIELRSDNIITYYPSKQVDKFTVPHLKKMLPILLDLADGKTVPYFSHNVNLKSIDSDAKTYIMEHMPKFARAFAMTEKSAVTRFMTHSMLTLWKPPFPVKMFKTEEEAFEWLKQNA